MQPSSHGYIENRTESSSFVPADSAEIGITDKIMVKLNTPESVSKVKESSSSWYLDVIA